jgi:hypothetical protein
MAADLPAPLTPLDCDLQDFPFMPLDVARLRDSDLASDESPEACWAAVLLWAASWHQVPAASIPDNDNWIAKQAGYAQRGKIAREWPAIRPGALRGWVMCGDGRFYHPVVAEKARDAWQAKCEQRWRTECGRIKKHNQRHGTNIPLPGFVAWTKAGRPQGQPLHVPEDKTGKGGDKGEDKVSKRQGEGQGDINKLPPIPPEGAKRRPAIALKTFLAECKAKNEKPIPDDDSVFDYAEKAGIPSDFLWLHWREFLDRYCVPEAKRYKAWRIVFGKSVRGNWFRLWYVDPNGEYLLTTVGVQAQNTHKGKAA